MNVSHFRLFSRRVGQDVRAWPMLALLVLVVLVAAGCVLWFMREAMQNERMAVRERLTEAYRSQLTMMQTGLVAAWNWRMNQLNGAEPAPARFDFCVGGDLADSVICLDEQGRAIYPRLPSAGGAQARDVEANKELLELESLTNHTDPQFHQVVNQLHDRVNDYTGNVMPSAQRRFIMHELQRLDSEVGISDTSRRGTGRPLSGGGPWQTIRASRHCTRPSCAMCGRPPRRTGAFWRYSQPPACANGWKTVFFRNCCRRACASRSARPGKMRWDITTVALGPALPGWRLSLSLDDRALFDTEAERRVARYLIIGSGVIAAMLVLAMFMARGFGRQVQLARLKNDLVANVSHELKTPLTAMRALVDTLLDTEKLDEKTTREYLKLLATENARLSRLIDNFLTFSRLERNKFRFEFAQVSPQRIVDGAMAAMGERAHAPGCTVESHVAAGIPEINGDADALTTALLNLLDNAWKYSGDNKHIVVRADARDGHVDFAVEDNGIGLSTARTAAGVSAVLSERPAAGADGGRLRAWPEHCAIDRRSAPWYRASRERVRTRQHVYHGDSCGSGERIMTPANILIIEDDPTILRVVKDNFVARGYRVRDGAQRRRRAGGGAEWRSAT